MNNISSYAAENFLSQIQSASKFNSNKSTQISDALIKSIAAAFEQEGNSGAAKTINELQSDAVALAKYLVQFHGWEGVYLNPKVNPLIFRARQYQQIKLRYRAVNFPFAKIGSFNHQSTNDTGYGLTSIDFNKINNVSFALGFSFSGQHTWALLKGSVYAASKSFDSQSSHEVFPLYKDSSTKDVIFVPPGELPGSAPLNMLYTEKASERQAASSGAVQSEYVPSTPTRVQPPKQEVAANKTVSTKSLPIPPTTMAEVDSRMAAATAKVELARKNNQPLPTSPYSTEDKFAIVDKGLDEKFIVRIIQKKYAKDSGSIGQLNKETKTSNYWTTTYTQLEYADKDAKLIANAVGITYDPNDEYTLLVIDTEKAAVVGKMETFIPTYEKIGEFAKQELVNDPKVELALVDAVLTPEYSKEYAHLYSKAKDDGMDLNNTKQFNKFAQVNGLSGMEKKKFKTRQTIHNKLGANEKFLGNGLTKDTNAPEGELRFGMVETYTYDKKPMELGHLESKNVLKRHSLNSHV